MKLDEVSWQGVKQGLSNFNQNALKDINPLKGPDAANFSPEVTAAKTNFINSFIGQAGQALNSAISGRMVDPNVKSGAAQPAAGAAPTSPAAANPFQQKQLAARKKAQGEIDNKPGAVQSAPKPSAMGNMAKQLTGNPTAAPGVAQPTTSSTGGTVTQTQTGQVHKANPNNPNIAAPAAAPTSAAPAANEPISIGGKKLNPKNPQDAAMIAKINAPKRPASPERSVADILAGRNESSHFDKLNSIFENIVNINEGAMSIGDWLEQYFYQQVGNQPISPDIKAQVKQWADEGEKEGANPKKALMGLANLVYAVAKPTYDERNRSGRGSGNRNGNRGGVNLQQVVDKMTQIIPNLSPEQLQAVKKSIDAAIAGKP